MPALFPTRAFRPVHAGLLVALSLTAGLAQADEAVIRKALSERFPNMPRIDEVTRTPMTGLWEVRMGHDLIYTDARGQYVLQGSLIDTATRRNLTEERVDKLTQIDFSSLPLKDAIVWKNGNGKRRIVVFADPNCGYCKRFEKDLLNVKDVTVYTFLYPILGPDSTDKSKQIWCAKDSTAVWRSWMVDGKAIPKAPACDTSAVDRNVALGRKHRVNGTPAIVFEDGSRVPGALPAAQIEERLASLK
jgi:thiol:disulfide interchange protein DsbC